MWPFFAGFKPEIGLGAMLLQFEGTCEPEEGVRDEDETQEGQKWGKDSPDSQNLTPATLQTT